MRHITLMSEQQSKENHGANVSEWDIELCSECGQPTNEAFAYDDPKEVIICSKCGNSRKWGKPRGVLN